MKKTLLWTLLVSSSCLASSGGESTENDLVRIFRMDGQMCTGTFVAPGVAILAAHCLENKPLANVYVTNSYGWSTKEHKAFKTWFHPEFDVNSENISKNDLAVVSFLDPIVDFDLVKKVKLSTVDAPLGEELSVTTFNRLKYPRLEQIRNSIVFEKYDIAGNTMSGHLTDSDERLCTGDSGTSVFSEKNKEIEIFGVLSTVKLFGWRIFQNKLPCFPNKAVNFTKLTPELVAKVKELALERKAHLEAKQACIDTFVKASYPDETYIQNICSNPSGAQNKLNCTLESMEYLRKTHPWSKWSDRSRSELVFSRCFKTM